MRMIDADKLEDALTEAGIPIIVKGKATSAWGVPIIEAEPVRHGHWIMHTSELYPSDSTMECDQCHHEQTIFMVDNNYCPNCGAKMDEVTE